jgi:hypothetical protein
VGIKDWVLLGLLLLVFLVRWLKGRSAGIEGKKATAAGGKAVQILEAAGYEILLVKPTLTVQMEIDGQPHSFTLKNDYLVKRHGQRYLVRLRRDNTRVRLQSKLWRSSLLRDVLAFRARGILILHLEKETLQEVRFRT